MDKDLQLVIELDDIYSGSPFCMPRLITQPRYVYILGKIKMLVIDWKSKLLKIYLSDKSTATLVILKMLWFIFHGLDKQQIKMCEDGSWI